jgi:hypothetical protein
VNLPLRDFIPKIFRILLRSPVQFEITLHALNMGVTNEVIARLVDRWGAHDERDCSRVGLR